jgi:hypothetical protein
VQTRGCTGGAQIATCAGKGCRAGEKGTCTPFLHKLPLVQEKDAWQKQKATCAGAMRKWPLVQKKKCMAGANGHWCRCLAQMATCAGTGCMTGPNGRLCRKRMQGRSKLHLHPVPAQVATCAGKGCMAEANDRLCRCHAQMASCAGKGCMARANGHLCRKKNAWREQMATCAGALRKWPLVQEKGAWQAQMVTCAGKGCMLGENGHVCRCHAQMRSRNSKSISAPACDTAAHRVPTQLGVGQYIDRSRFQKKNTLPVAFNQSVRRKPAPQSCAQRHEIFFQNEAWRCLPNFGEPPFCRRKKNIGRTDGRI